MHDLRTRSRLEKHAWRRTLDALNAVNCSWCAASLIQCKACVSVPVKTIITGQEGYLGLSVSLDTPHPHHLASCSFFSLSFSFFTVPCMKSTLFVSLLSGCNTILKLLFCPERSMWICIAAVQRPLWSCVKENERKRKIKGNKVFL